MKEIVFDPIIPLPWIMAIGAVFVAATTYVYVSVGSRVGWKRNALLAASRLLAVALILLALLQPSRKEETPADKKSNVLLVGLDTSRSMRQADAAEKTTRLQFAKDLLHDSGLDGADEASAVRLFQFSEDAASLPSNAFDAMKADGTTTNFHRSLQTMLGSLRPDEAARGMVLLTDGHDLELTSPTKTAFAARSRRVPVYAVPVGAQGLVRDASVSITNYQPYCFVKQRAHITANVRVIGCEHETITVQLLRQDQVVKTTSLDVGERSDLPVDFEVSEAEPGQYPYEIRVVPLPKENDLKNNSALTFVNVVDQQISVLLLEGAPYWDTSFLERSLFGNDKVALDAVLQYKPGQARLIRKTPDAGTLKVPATEHEFEHYDVVILGRAVDRILDGAQRDALRSFVRDHGGVVIFGRGQAYSDSPDDLDPVTWDNKGDGDVSLQAGRDSGSFPMFRTLADGPGGMDSLPALLGARGISDRKTLAAILAEARDPGTGNTVPAIIHRRYGRGQVMSVAVEGLWRWSFNPKTAVTNNLFDRFWDQFLVWLVAGADTNPGHAYSFRANTANLLLGEAVHLRLVAHDLNKSIRETPVTIFCDEKPVARASLVSTPDNPTGLHADFQPEKTGRYRASAVMPDGKPQEVKWMVYEDNPEEKEVAADVPYLKTLCESSGGCVLAPDELKSMVETLQRPPADLRPKTRLISLWDRASVFYLVCFALGLDWYLRRKWGLC